MKTATVRLTEIAKENLKSKANLAGMSMSEYIELAIRYITPEEIIEFKKSGG